MNSYLNQECWLLDDNKIYIEKECMTKSVFADAEQDLLMDMEERSWWFKYRSEVIMRVLDLFYDKSKLTIDIGAGNGYTSSVASNRGFRVGIIEPSMQACSHAQKRGISEICCGTISDKTIVDDSIEQAMMLDVLEHIEDDDELLSVLRRKLVRGGMLTITVPAFMLLWSSNDEMAGHYRRYRINALCRKIQSHGFVICYRSYFMSFLYVPILIFRVILERAGMAKRRDRLNDKEKKNVYDAEFTNQSVFISRVLSFFELVEGFLMRGENRVPFGSSIIIVARKK